MAFETLKLTYLLYTVDYVGQQVPIITRRIDRL